MEALERILHTWEQVLNEDGELKMRIKSPSSQMEGKTAVQLKVGGGPAYVVQVRNGGFSLEQAAGDAALLRWNVPLPVFKDVLLGRHRLIFSILDPSAELAFDTQGFTHWDGATIIEMLLVAQEMAERQPEIKYLVQSLECSSHEA